MKDDKVVREMYTKSMAALVCAAITTLILFCFVLTIFGYILFGVGSVVSFVFGFYYVRKYSKAVNEWLKDDKDY